MSAHSATMTVTAHAPCAIPLMRPRLPTAKQLSGYLELIDSTRWYTNDGPLTRRFERRLAEHFGAPDGSVVCVCNGTLGLVLTLMTFDPRPGDLCAIPAWTFAASPASAVAAGFVPWFMDVAEETWSVDADYVRAQLSQAPGRVRAVMVVSPFGAPVDLVRWRRFRAETGIEVVVDAAAGFDALRIDDVPAVVSLDASKIFGIGQGGFVATTNESFGECIRRGRNYGFVTERISESIGVNAKISEYAAAVGLARLDDWPAHRAAYQNVTNLYVEMLGCLGGVELQPAFGEGWYTSVLNVRIGTARAEQVIGELAARGIEARRWWGSGCHRQPAFARFPRCDLPVTESLAASVVGLPFSPDITPEEIVTVGRALGEVLGDE